MSDLRLVLELLRFAHPRLRRLLSLLFDPFEPQVLVHSSLSLEDLLLQCHVTIQVILLLVQCLQDLRVELPLLFELSGLDACNLLLRDSRPYFRLAVRDFSND